MAFHVIFAGFAFLSILSSASSAACSSTTYLSLSSGSTRIITSPNYPLNYPSPSTTCRWRITAPYGYKVKITFTSFDTYGSGSCSASFTNDYLDVYDSSFEWISNHLGRYCGSSLPPTLVSSGRYMYLKFSTNSNTQLRKGFRIEMTAFDKIYCGSLLLTADSSTTKIITTPNYPSNYPTSSSCAWRITAPSGNVVQLKFTSFNIYGTTSAGSCALSSNNHNLDIYDSSTAISSKLLGKYCGNFVPANVVSRGRYMFLKFSSPSSFSKTGFRIEYKAVKDPPEDHSTCSPFNSASTNDNIKFQASSSYKYIKSPYYPNKYPSNIQCTWTISASSSSKRIKLILTDVKIHNSYSYSCSSTKDSLTIRDGSSSYRSLLKQLCGTSYSTTTVTSTGQKMWIRFKTNSDNYFTWSTQAGFQAKFIEVKDSSSNAGMIVGIIFGVAIFVGLIVCCIWVSKRQGNAGHVQGHGAATSVQTTTTTHPPPVSTPQYPLQQVGPVYQGRYPAAQLGGSYTPAQLGGNYPPPPPGSSYMYPPAPPGGSYPPVPPGGTYPQQPQGSGYPPDIPPPEYPGPPTYPPQSNDPHNVQFQGPQPNAPYPPPQGSENQVAAAYPTKAGAPPQF